MKAISIKEPWAGLIHTHVKSIETRTWATKYRGRLLLCASRSPKSDISGKAFAIVNLVDCVPMTKQHLAAACCPVYPDAWAWLLEDVTPLADPFPVTGQLGLFDVDYEEAPVPRYLGLDLEAHPSQMKGGHS